MPRLSPELQAAQARLLQLRAERGVNQGVGRRACVPPAALPSPTGDPPDQLVVGRPASAGGADGPLAPAGAPHPDGLHSMPPSGFGSLNYANQPDSSAAPSDDALSSRRDAEAQGGFPSSPASQRLGAITHPRAEAQGRGEEEDDRPACAPPVPNWPLINARKELHRRRAAVGGNQWPVGSGQWPVISDQGAVGNDQWEEEAPPRSPSPPPPCIPVHPTLLLAILRHNHAAAARVWLLLRHGDATGSGRYDLNDARRLLTAPGAPLRCCGARRLRQILAEGEGLFWRRDAHGRLWLVAAHKVAHALDCDRMQGAPVELPVAALRGGIHAVRAAFYAAFHSGRAAAPISRDTLAALSGVAPRTQLEYDRAAGVGRRRNVAVGERYNDERFRERAWERGRAAFRFIDTAGRQGRAGGEYVAWHLPNSYEGPYPRRAPIGRKRLNRKLADLVIKGTPGNGGSAAERVFWPDGAAAARSYNRGPDRDAYWHATPAPGRPMVWHVMAGQGGASLPAGDRYRASFPACGGREKKNAS